MSKYVIDDSTLIAIADAVREKDGTSAPIKVSDLGERILAIPAGGGGELPEEAFNITGNCTYRFSNDGWNWYLDAYGNRINTNGLATISSMFYQSSKLKSIPFDLNVGIACKVMNSCFYGCESLTELPLIKGDLIAPTSDYGGTLNISNLFYACREVREIPYDYFHNFGGDAFWEASKNYKGARNNIFNNCSSLRQLPDISMLKTKETSTYNSLYYSAFGSCYSLDEVVNIPVLESTITSNHFSSTFNLCGRLKAITFETNADGSPIVAQWKSQTIDLSSSIGYISVPEWITQYNSGITADKRVTDNTTYVALKDDPDWFSSVANYSRYNHDSAVATINSLPDTSAYGTNTIKFEGAAGALTDGGAINTLTEAEIAVAAAKGWTVTLA